LCYLSRRFVRSSESLRQVLCSAAFVLFAVAVAVSIRLMLNR